MTGWLTCSAQTRRRTLFDGLTTNGEGLAAAVDPRLLADGAESLHAPDMIGGKYRRSGQSDDEKQCLKSVHGLFLR